MKLLNAYQKEYEGIFDMYMNMNRMNEPGSDEVLFRDFLKSKASDGLYKMLYQ